MTDVRLVATNPEDSTLVPVATNNRGELAVQYPKIEKLPNDLEVVGDLDVTGTASFKGDISCGTTVSSTTAQGAYISKFGGVYAMRPTGSIAEVFAGYQLGTALPTASISATGAASFVTSQFSIEADAATEIHRAVTDTSKINVQHTLRGGYKTPGGTNQTKWAILADGGATFKSDVVIGSRGTQWLIRESNGVAMLIEQTRRQQQPREIKVRDLPRELDLVEAALNEIMGKLKMTPPAGWPVWDGSDNSQ